MDSERALVIILSSTLVVFLLLGIVAVIKVIQILNHLKKITEKAEKLADKVEHVGEFFQKTAGPLAIGKLVANVAEAIRNHKHKD